MERFLDAVTTGTLEEVLVRIAVQFVPAMAALAEEVHRIAKVAPLSALFTQKLTEALIGITRPHVGHGRVGQS